MQGIYIAYQRPKSKKAIREACANTPELVTVEATSMFGDEFDGHASNLTEGAKVFFVGPDPYIKRNFYGTLSMQGGKLVVT